MRRSKISKLWMPRSELLCAPRHAKLSALLGPRPWHRHVTVAPLAVERQETSLLAQGTHRLPSEFLWIWCSERNVSNASNWGRTLNQNRSVFVSNRQGMHCKDSQSAFYMHFKQRYPQTSLPCTEHLDHPNGGWSVWHPCPGHGMKFAAPISPTLKFDIFPKKMKYQHLSPFWSIFSIIACPVKGCTPLCQFRSMASPRLAGGTIRARGSPSFAAKREHVDLCRVQIWKNCVRIVRCFDVPRVMKNLFSRVSRASSVMHAQTNVGREKNISIYNHVASTMPDSNVAIIFVLQRYGFHSSPLFRLFDWKLCPENAVFAAAILLDGRHRAGFALCCFFVFLWFSILSLNSSVQKSAKTYLWLTPAYKITEHGSTIKCKMFHTECSDKSQYGTVLSPMKAR